MYMPWEGFDTKGLKVADLTKRSRGNLNTHLLASKPQKERTIGKPIRLHNGEWREVAISRLICRWP